MFLAPHRGDGSPACSFVCTHLSRLCYWPVCVPTALLRPGATSPCRVVRGGHHLPQMALWPSSHPVNLAALHSAQVQLWPEVPESREGGRADLLLGCFWFADQQWLLRGETRLASSWQQLQQDHAAEKELEAAVPSDSWCQTDPKTQPYPQVRSQSKVVHPQFLWRHERNVRRKRASFKLERIIKKQRLLEVHRGPEQLRALCWLQDDRPRRTTFPALCPGALVPGPHRRSRLTSCSSPRLRRPCGWHSAQLRRYSPGRPPGGTG